MHFCWLASAFDLLQAAFSWGQAQDDDDDDDDDHGDDDEGGNDDEAIGEDDVYACRQVLSRGWRCKPLHGNLHFGSKLMP